MHKDIKYYFINKFETNNIDKLDNQTTIIYRNYSSETLNEKLILKIKNYCKKKGIKFFLSNNIQIAIKLNLDGAYIPSFNKNTKHLAYSFKKNFKIVGSAHNLKEIRTKELILTTGTFLNGLIHIGETQIPAGRYDEKPSTGLSERLVKFKMQIGRLKTGTPPRLDGDTINYDDLEMQPADDDHY